MRVPLGCQSECVIRTEFLLTRSLPSRVASFDTFERIKLQFTRLTRVERRDQKCVRRASVELHAHAFVKSNKKLAFVKSNKKIV